MEMQCNAQCNVSGFEAKRAHARTKGNATCKHKTLGFWGNNPVNVRAHNTVNVHSQVIVVVEGLPFSWSTMHLSLNVNAASTTTDGLPGSALVASAARDAANLKASSRSAAPPTAAAPAALSPPPPPPSPTTAPSTATAPLSTADQGGGCATAAAAAATSDGGRVPRTLAMYTFVTTPCCISLHAFAFAPPPNQTVKPSNQNQAHMVNECAATSIAKNMQQIRRQYTAYKRRACQGFKFQSRKKGEKAK